MKKQPYCNFCEEFGHYEFQCFKKPRQPINRNKIGRIRPKNKTVQQEREFKNQWIQDNPPDQYGFWTCYLQIHPNCPVRISIELLALEHVIPKSRGKKYKYDPKNIRPSEYWCNSLKGSRTLESLAKDYPHLKVYLA